MFELIITSDEDCIYDEDNDRKYCLDDLDDLIDLVKYINELQLSIEDLKLNTVSSNIYHLQHVNDNVQELIDYDGKHDFIIDIDKKDNQKLISLLEELEKRGDTYLQTSIILAKKLGFESSEEFLSAIQDGYLEHI